MKACEALQFLPGTSPYVGALMKRRVLLPDVSRLAFGDKLQGALTWLDFIGDGSDAESCCISEAAKGQASVIRDTAEKRSLRDAADVWRRLMKRSRAIPAPKRAQLWAKTIRRLVSLHNGRAIFKRVTGKFRRHPR